MKTASIKELKDELQQLKPSELVGLGVRLARFKKENKELLTYLLFDSLDEARFVEEVKSAVEEGFEGMNRSNLYFAKKTLRKLVRMIQKYCRYSGRPDTEIELRIHFCECLVQSGIAYSASPVIMNLYQNQRKKIQAALKEMHEDLQYEFSKRVAALP